MVLVRLLGRVEVYSDHGWIKAGAPKQACVLAALAMSPGSVVPTDVLVGRLWDGSSPTSGRAVIHSHVARLRRLLEPYDSITLARAAGGGYQLDAGADDIDLFAMRRLVDLAQSSEASGDDDAARRRWDEAVALWRGPALSGVPGSWAAHARERLETEHLDIMLARLGHRYRTGDDAAIIPELGDLATRSPTSEPVTTLLMRALYRNGRAGEALERYESIRRRLRDELGADPSEALQRLQVAILRNEDVDAGIAVTDKPVPATGSEAAQRPRQLPADVSTFTGRADQVTSLVEQLRRVADGDPSAARVAVIDGMAGVGKTALAVHAANAVAGEFDDGQLFIDLHGFASDVSPVRPGDALARMMRALGVPAAGLAENLADRAAQFRSLLADRRMLVVLDNAVDEQQLLPLLPGTSRSVVVVTSRRKLSGLDDVTVVSLDELSTGEAIDLFDRVCHHPAQMPLAVSTEVVELCGRLPLAIRLAAARLRSRPSWTFTDLRDRLLDHNRRLRELRAGQRSIEAAFDLSYGELDDQAARTLALLGTTTIPQFSLRAVATLIGEPESTTETILDRLVDDNLVLPAGPDAYSLHDLVRLFGRRRAATDLSPAEVKAAAQRLNSWYLHTARHAVTTARLLGNGWLTMPEPVDGVRPTRFVDMADARRWLDRERPNLLALTLPSDGNDPSGDWELIETLFDYFLLSLDTATLTTIAGKAMSDAVARDDRDAEALSHLRLAAVHHMGADFSGDEKHARAALKLLGEDGPTPLKTRAWMRLAVAAASRGDLPGARELIAHAVDLQRKDPDNQFAVVLNITGAAASESGDLHEAIGYFTEALETLRAAESPRTYVVQGNLGLTHLKLGNLEQAQRHLDLALAAARRGGSRRDETSILDNLARLELLRSRHDRARGLSSLAHKVARESQLRYIEPAMLVTLAATYPDRPAEAESLARRALAQAEEFRAGSATIRALLALADVVAADPNRLDEAVDLTVRAIKRAESGGYRLMSAHGHAVLGSIRLAQSDPDEAIRLGDTALSVQRAAGDRPHAAVSHRLLAAAHRAAGRFGAADHHERAGRELAEEIGVAVASLGLTTG